MLVQSTDDIFGSPAIERRRRRTGLAFAAEGRTEQRLHRLGDVAGEFGVLDRTLHYVAMT
jgi:hypothetical protein